MFFRTRIRDHGKIVTAIGLVKTEIRKKPLVEFLFEIGDLRNLLVGNRDRQDVMLDLPIPALQCDDS